MTITPSHILEYLFCPRFTYFEYVLCIPQYEEKFHKVMLGRDIHEKKTIQNAEYLRKRIGAISKYQNQYLTNEHLRGEVDEVLELSDGTMAPLDYKFAEFKDKIYDTYKMQLYCYAVLIEENFGKKVEKGYLVYVRSRNKLVEIEIPQEKKLLVNKMIYNVLEIIDEKFYPKATRSKKKCISCTYKNICTK